MTHHQHGGRGNEIEALIMWNESTPKWRTARKQYQCQGDGCAKVIASGEQYLDRALDQPANNHLRYCKECAKLVWGSSSDDHFLNGRSDFPDRYAQRISSAEWKSLRRKIIEQRGNLCEKCGHEGGSLVLHHLHYKSMGNEQPEDVQLLCSTCHEQADEERAAVNRLRLRRVLPRQAGTGWTSELDQQLRLRWEACASTEELVLEFERTKGAITSRLAKLGLPVDEPGSKLDEN
jgi:5-methylcytosine-specific restriction protein A